MTVSASIVVAFGDTSGAAMLIAELDDDQNNSKQSFLTTETAYFTIYKYPSNMIINTPIPTSGMVNYARTVRRTKMQTLNFINTQNIDLDYPPAGSVTVTRWYGNVGAGFSVSGVTASITSEEPCICDISYGVSGDMWELYPPGIDLAETPEYPIIVLVTGDNA